MDLKDILPTSDKAQTEYFWALVIEPGWIQAGIWRIVDTSAQVVLSGPPSAWSVEEELVDAADTALSAAIQNFPEELEEPSKTVFGVISDWVAEGEIKPEHLDKIKTVCEKLSLTPVGFVVLSEAISHFVKSQEGSPTSAVILGVYSEALEVTVYKLGNHLGTTTVSRSVSIADDVVEGLSRFVKGESIPSRFILFDGKGGELEDVRQNLTQVEWESFSQLKFHHTPKIEIIDPEQKVHAVSLAGASEIADVTTIQTPEAKKEEPREEELTDIDEIQESDVAPVPMDDREKLGFVLEKDINEIEEVPDFSESVDLSQNEDGQMEMQDMQMRPQKRKKLKLPTHLFSGIVGKFSRKKKGVAMENNMHDMRGAASLAEDAPEIPTKKRKRKLPGLGGFGMGKKLIAVGLIFMIVLMSTGVYAWWFYPKAVVTLYLSPKQLEEKITVTVDPRVDTLDVENKILPAEKVTTSVEGEKTKSTTGVKTVGDKAKGAVTFYRVGPELNLASGTILVGPGQLRFSLDSALTVASGSASSPSETKGDVTAEDIGSEYNLASGTSFSVGNYSTSDIEALNESSFSGGSSRDVNVVDEDDLVDLSNDLEEELITQGIEQLKKDLPVSNYIIEGSEVFSSKSKQYSADEGDEASTVKLNLSGDVSLLSTDKSKLTELARAALADRIPDGFILREDQVVVDFELVGDTEGETYTFDVSVKANLLPEVKTDEIIKNISGKYPGIAQDYFQREVPGFSKAEITLTPALPGKLGTLPRVPGNITVEVSAAR